MKLERFGFGRTDEEKVDKKETLSGRESSYQVRNEPWLLTALASGCSMSSSNPWTTRNADGNELHSA